MSVNLSTAMRNMLYVIASLLFGGFIALNAWASSEKNMIALGVAIGAGFAATALACMLRFGGCPVPPAFSNHQDQDSSL